MEEELKVIRLHQAGLSSGEATDTLEVLAARCIYASFGAVATPPVGVDGREARVRGQSRPPGSRPC